MSSQAAIPKNSPHLTPEKLVGLRFPKNTFGKIKVALVGYCPRPAVLDRYAPRDTTDQYFIHVSPASVQICRHAGVEFLSIVHVYGGPVSAALVEELGYYGIDTILAYGLAGGLGTRGLKMGDFYLVERALVQDGTTPHYTADTRIPSDAGLNARILDLSRKAHFPEMTPVQAMTGDALYRESDEKLTAARVAGCDIVNLDSSHLFAVSRAVGIRSTECGVISDVVGAEGEDWESKLAVMLAPGAGDGVGPMELTGKIVEFFVEVVMPKLDTGSPPPVFE
jgi:hypothetical protein